MILVSGASGFVGRALCALLAARGRSLRAATRSAAAAGGHASVPVGDIGPDTDWRAALHGCDAIVHLAAHVHVMRADAVANAAFHRVNVDGTANFATQAARAGVRRFVFLSSVKVNGESSMERPLREDDPVVPVDAYGASKAEAEARLRTIAADTGMEVVIVRPPLVYGPGVKANFLSLLRVVDVGIPLPLASVDNRRSLVFVGNLVDALERCLDHPAAAGRTFFASDGLDVATPGLVRAMASALGRKPRLFPFPPALLHAAGALSGKSAEVERLTQSLQVDDGAIKTSLGWRAPYSLQQGLAETVAWFRSRKG